MASSARRQAVGMMAACSTLWSIAGILIKLIPWNAMVIAGVRSLLAAGVMYIFLRRSGMKVRWNRYSAVSALLMSLTMFSFIFSNKLTTAANAIVLEYTSPAFILIFSAVFFHQKFHRADLIAVIATIFGISLFFFDQLSGGRLFGNCVAIFSGVVVAWQYIINGKADTESRMSGILIGHLITAAIGIPMIAVFPPVLTGTAVGSMLVLGVVQLGVPYILYGLALKNCPPLACSLVGAIEPMLNPVWVFLLDGEKPGVFPLIGAVIVLAAVTGWCVWRDRFVTEHSNA